MFNNPKKKNFKVLEHDELEYLRSLIDIFIMLEYLRSLIDTFFIYVYLSITPPKKRIYKLLEPDEN